MFGPDAVIIKGCTVTYSIESILTNRLSGTVPTCLISDQIIRISPNKYNLN